MREAVEQGSNMLNMFDFVLAMFDYVLKRSAAAV
jgi:hypothetical protein